MRRGSPQRSENRDRAAKALEARRPHVQQTVLFTPDGWDADDGVFVAQTPQGEWRVGLVGLPDEVSPAEAESVAACLFRAAAEARLLGREADRRA